MTETSRSIALAPGAEENGFAVMLTHLLRQNLDAHPEKARDLAGIGRGSVSIVAEDAEVALTLAFERGTVLVQDGIVGIPDLAIRGDADTILALSNIPTPSLRAWRTPEVQRHLRDVAGALRKKTLRFHGAILHAPTMLRVARLLSVV
jgi:hypothetical protein